MNISPMSFAFTKIAIKVGKENLDPDTYSPSSFPHYKSLIHPLQYYLIWEIVLLAHSFMIIN